MKSDGMFLIQERLLLLTLRKLKKDKPIIIYPNRPICICCYNDKHIKITWVKQTNISRSCIISCEFSIRLSKFTTQDSVYRNNKSLVNIRGFVSPFQICVPIWSPHKKRPKIQHCIKPYCILMIIETWVRVFWHINVIQ